MATKSDENLDSLSRILGSEDENLVNEAVLSLRAEATFKGALKLVADYYDKTENQNIKKNIEGFFNDLKEGSLRKEIIALTKLPYKTDTSVMILASCWQSGLDYSDFVMDFAALFVSGDYRIALECMTIIDEMAGKISQNNKKQASALIKTSKNREKAGLAIELATILEN